MSTLHEFTFTWREGDSVLYYDGRVECGPLDAKGNAVCEWWLWETATDILWYRDEFMFGVGDNYADGVWVTYAAKEHAKREIQHIMAWDRRVARARERREVAKSKPEPSSEARKFFLGKFSNLRIENLKRENGKVHYWLTSKTPRRFRDGGPLSVLRGVAITLPRQRLQAPPALAVRLSRHSA